MRRAVGGLGAAAALALSGCVLFSGPRREFVSQDEVLGSIARTAGFAPDEGLWRLVHAEVSQDSITLQYLGVEHPGDSAWVIRFSQKSTEQRPESLGTLSGMVLAIAKGKEGFEAIEKGERTTGDLPVEFARYRSRSTIRDEKGRPVEAAGIAAIVKIDRAPAPVLYQINVENYAGDRPEVGWGDLEPFLKTIRD
jgi:hypothetical protein